MSKKWSAFCAWLDVAAEAAVDGIKRMEVLGITFSVDTFRNVRLLKVPTYKMRLGAWLASSVKKVADVDHAIVELAKEQTLEWIWRDGNPKLHKDKVKDLTLRKRFAEEVKFTHMKVNMPGTWRWKADDPYPGWDKILHTVMHTVVHNGAVIIQGVERS